MNEPRAISAKARSAKGIVLLEVIFALMLFVAGASVVLSGMSACLRSAQRLEGEAVADDLAVTLVSEIQMKLVPAEDDGPNEYEEPYESWTWEIVTSEFQDVIDNEGPEMMRIEVIIANAVAGNERRMVFMLPAPADDLLTDDDSGDSFASDGGAGR